MFFTKRTAIFVLFMAWATLCRPALAAPITLQILDQHGAPVSGAVLMAPAVSTGTAPDTSPDTIAIMDQVEKAFVPNVLVIEQGQRVNFPNSDNIRHHVYSFSKPKVFELKLYAKQPEHPIEFAQPGVVVLGCNIHDQMLGFILVSDTPVWATTDEAGQAQLDLNAAHTQVRLWHPNLASGFDQLQTLPVAHTSSTATLTIDLKSPQPPATPKRGFSSDRFRQHGQ